MYGMRPYKIHTKSMGLVRGVSRVGAGGCFCAGGYIEEFHHENSDGHSYCTYRCFGAVVSFFYAYAVVEGAVMPR